MNIPELRNDYLQLSNRVNEMLRITAAAELSQLLKEGNLKIWVRVKIGDNDGVRRSRLILDRIAHLDEDSTPEGFFHAHLLHLLSFLDNPNGTDTALSRRENEKIVDGIVWYPGERLQDVIDTLFIKIDLLDDNDAVFTLQADADIDIAEEIAGYLDTGQLTGYFDKIARNF